MPPPLEAHVEVAQVSVNQPVVPDCKGAFDAGQECGEGHRCVAGRSSAESRLATRASINGVQTIGVEELFSREGREPDWFHGIRGRSVGKLAIGPNVGPWHTTTWLHTM